MKQLKDAGMDIKKYPEEFEGVDLRRVNFVLGWKLPEGLLAQVIYGRIFPQLRD